MYSHSRSVLLGFLLKGVYMPYTPEPSISIYSLRVSGLKQSCGLYYEWGFLPLPVETHLELKIVGNEFMSDQHIKVLSNFFRFLGIAFPYCSHLH